MKTGSLERIVGVLALTAICSSGTAADTREVVLTLEPRAWKAVVAAGLGDTPVERGCAFTFEHDRRVGPTLAIGPWRLGTDDARLDYAHPLSFTTGTIRGLYRTEGLPARGAEVLAFFESDSGRVARNIFRLPPARDWTPFAIPLRVSPPGALRMAPSFGIGLKGAGRVLFARLRVSPDAAALSFRTQTPLLVRPAAPLRQRSAAFYRLTESAGTHWLIAPDGRPFYSLGAVGPSFDTSAEGLTRGERWADFLRGAGFNTLAGWTSVESWAALNAKLGAEGHAPFPLTFSLHRGDMEGFDWLVDSKGERNRERHSFPDPFDPAFARVYREKVHAVASMVRAQPWFVAWFADNEVSHRDLHRYVYSPHCAEALRRWLETRHHDIGALNARWGTHFESFEGLIAARPDPVGTEGPVVEDLRQFAREIVRQYVDVTLGAIRAEDPDHLVFSNRFMLEDMTEWIDLIDLYTRFDGIAINIYPANRTAGLDANERWIFREAYRRTKKPILIGEWSIPAVDSGLYSDGAKLDWSWNEVLPTQTERGRQAAQVTADFFNMPFLVGTHWYRWVDLNNEERRANRGLVTVDEKPWPELLAALTRVNTRIQKRVAPR